MDKENIVRTQTRVPRTARRHVVFVSVLVFDFDLGVLIRREFPVIDFGDDDSGGWSGGGASGKVAADDMVVGDGVLSSIFVSS